MTAAAGSSQTDSDGRIDKLTQALIYVAGELWVTRDRQMVLERALADSGINAAAAIDTYRPDEALTAQLTAQRDGFIADIMGYLAPGA